MEQTILMAVYGTLKQGHHSHTIHLKQEPKATGNFDFKAHMYSNGRYPMLVKSESTQQIYFEIYEINNEQLVAIDGLELPFGYHRELCEFNLHGQAWVYFYSNSNVPDEFLPVKTGCFEKEKEW